MLIYLDANLHPEGVKPAVASAAAKTISKALIQDHDLRADSIEGQKIALAWLCDPSTETYRHDGATGGYSAYASFNLKDDYPGVVLLNASIGPKGSLADLLGEHIRERLAGKPAISLYPFD